MVAVINLSSVFEFVSGEIRNVHQPGCRQFGNKPPKGAVKFMLNTNKSAVLEISVKALEHAQIVLTGIEKPKSFSKLHVNKNVKMIPDGLQEVGKPTVI